MFAHLGKEGGGPAKRRLDRAESAAETALSILGEILATRAGRQGGRLRDARGSIHVEPSELSLRT